MNKFGIALLPHIMLMSVMSLQMMKMTININHHRDNRNADTYQRQ